MFSDAKVVLLDGKRVSRNAYNLFIKGFETLTETEEGKEFLKNLKQKLKGSPSKWTVTEEEMKICKMFQWGIDEFDAEIGYLLKVSVTKSGNFRYPAKVIKYPDNPPVLYQDIQNIKFVLSELKKDDRELFDWFVGNVKMAHSFSVGRQAFLYQSGLRILNGFVPNSVELTIKKFMRDDYEFFDSHSLYSPLDF